MRPSNSYTASNIHTIRIILLTGFLFLVLSPETAFAGRKSTERNEKYRAIALIMEELYNNGNLHQVIDLFNNQCRKEGKGEGGQAGKWKTGRAKKAFKKVKKEIRADIYHYLALSYFALHRPESGKPLIRKILVLRRDENIDNYWRSIRKFADSTYTVAPKILIGFKGGVNFTSVTDHEPYSIIFPDNTSGLEVDIKKYLGFADSRGTQMGFSTEYVFSSTLSIAFQPTFYNMSFHYENEISLDETDVTMFHRHLLSNIELPLLMRYRITFGKIQPYIQVGGLFRFMTQAVKTLKVKAPYAGENEFLDEDDYSVTKQFSRLNGGLIVGAGIGFNSGKISFQFEMNVKFLLNNIVNKDNRFENGTLVYGYYDVFDDMKISNVEFSLKVMIPVSFKAFRK